ncbi:MAG: FecR domain-containing protein [Sphingomonas sp.]|nr:FecR domain-containing protein [Sphingomonas sp.]
MADVNDRIRDEAVAWHVRLHGDAASADWAGFTAWLEADPAHAQAYDLVALADAELDDLPLAPVAPMPAYVEPHRSNRRAFLGWGGAAIAAALVGAITLMPAGGTYEIVTAPGERRVIALEEGSRIEVNGDSRLVLDRGDARFARIERGEALFTVVHDDARPFRVEAGEARLIDLGTVFNVLHDGDRTEVAVSEGEVEWRRANARMNLTPGMALSQRGTEDPVVTRPAIASIGGWREGRLSYSAARYDAVVADLSRNLGARVALDGAVAARRFSGVIVIDRDPGVTLDRAGALLELDARREGDGWRLTVERGARP